MIKPRVFIGSSAEGLDLTNAVHANLQRVAHPKPWTQGVFGLSQPTLLLSCPNGIRHPSSDRFARPDPRRVRRQQACW